MTSPSRVTTVRFLFSRRIASALRAFSTTTVLPRSCDRSSEISEERTCANSGVRCPGMTVAFSAPAVWTKTSAWPRFSLRRVVNAVTAALISRTTIASARVPRAAAVADSHPASIWIREAILPRRLTPRASRTKAAAPSRDCEVIFIASSFDSTEFRSRSAARSCSMKSWCFFFALSSADLATSNCESRPSSPASAPAISISNWL